MTERNPTPYWDYLKLDRLLTLQSGLDDDEENISADELHFIVVHQTFELWFKVVIRELKEVQEALFPPEWVVVPARLRCLRWVGVRVWAAVLAQEPVLESAA